MMYFQEEIFHLFFLQKEGLATKSSNKVQKLQNMTKKIIQ